MKNNGFVSDKDLVELGFPVSSDRAIIHKAREILVSRGFEFYQRGRLMVVPAKVVEEILGGKI